MKFTRSLLSRRNQKGVAIIIAVFCVVMISFIVTEVTYESNIEYAVHARSVQRLKAYYAARAGVEMSLLRIKIYQKLAGQYGKQLGSQANMLNLIWSFPLNWPPVIPEAATAVDKDLVKEKVAESKMDAQFVSMISDEGSKIDINDLDSPSKGLRESTKKQLLRIFEIKKQNEPEWAQSHSDFKPEDFVNNLIDWVDADTKSLVAGDERQLYPDIPQDIQNYPPNRHFRTVQELRLVAGMTDELFQILEPRITVYGAKAINPNTAPRDLLMSLDASMTDEIVTEITTRRDDPTKGGAFAKAEEFWEFVNSKGGRVSPEVQKEIPLTFDLVSNFRIRSIGSFAGENREIEVVVFDLTSAAKVVAEKAKKEKDEEAGKKEEDSAAKKDSSKTAAAPAQTATKGPPRIVYWSEK